MQHARQHQAHRPRAVASMVMMGMCVRGARSPARHGSPSAPRRSAPAAKSASIVPPSRAHVRVPIPQLLHGLWKKMQQRRRQQNPNGQTHDEGKLLPQRAPSPARAEATPRPRPRPARRRRRRWRRRQWRVKKLMLSHHNAKHSRNCSTARSEQRRISSRHLHQ